MHRDGGKLDSEVDFIFCFTQLSSGECDEGEKKKGVEGICSDAQWNLAKKESDMRGHEQSNVCGINDQGERGEITEVGFERVTLN